MPLQTDRPRPMLSLPWNDRAGRLSPLKLAVFALLFVPGLWITYRWGTGGLGGKPLTQALHEVGDWAVRLLVVSLAITPMRRIGLWPKLFLVRRMVGLSVLAYALVHLALYVVDQNYDVAKVASEIALRFYLTIGFVALVGLCILGATSTDGMVRRLGKAWPRLHRGVYVIAVLGLVHYFLQSKIDVTNPVFWTGLFLGLMGHRLMQRLGWPTTWATLVGLAVAAGLATALIEVAWYAVATGVSALDVLNANLDFSYDVRPAWWVLGIGLALSLLNLVRTQSASPKPVRGDRPVPARA
jgi:methionine sulfoxide reductase heme-binding subunit